MLKLPTRLWPKGQKWAEYNEVVPPGIPLSAVLSRDYWLHVHAQIRPFDVISCVAEDGSFDVDIRLLSKTSTDMKFRIIRQAECENAEPIEAEKPEDRYRVQSGGRAGGWRVVERSTGQVIADGIDKVAAEAEAARLNAGLREAA